MTTSDRDPYHPVQAAIWIPPSNCTHPRERLNFTGHFPPENPNLSVFDAHCYQCGSHWDETAQDAPWTELMLKFAHGEFGVVSLTDPEIASKVEWRRQNRYGQIMDDANRESTMDGGS